MPRKRNVRAGELDAFVFDQVRATMLRPDVLLAGEAASVSTRREAGSDELLATQLARLDRKIDTVATERRRLADLYFKRASSSVKSSCAAARNWNYEASALSAQRQALDQSTVARNWHSRTGCGTVSKALPVGSSPPSIDWTSPSVRNFFAS